MTSPEMGVNSGLSLVGVGILLAHDGEHLG